MIQPALRSVLLALLAAAAACSGPKHRAAETTGARPGESTAPLPTDPSQPNPDAAGLPASTPELPAPADDGTTPR